jgi:hypothetical protein
LFVGPYAWKKWAPTGRIFVEFGPLRGFGLAATIASFVLVCRDFTVFSFMSVHLSASQLAIATNKNFAALMLTNKYKKEI